MGCLRDIFSWGILCEGTANYLSKISALRLRFNLMLPLITEDLPCRLLAFTNCYQISCGVLNPDVCLWDGYNNTILGSAYNCVMWDTIWRGVIYSFFIFLSISGWGFLPAVCVQVCNVQTYMIERADVSIHLFLLQCVSMCVSVCAHIWSESVHVSGRWLGREVAGAIKNLRCFHRDDGNLRDFPYGSEIIRLSRSFKYPRLIPPPC